MPLSRLMARGHSHNRRIEGPLFVYTPREVPRASWRSWRRVRAPCHGPITVFSVCVPLVRVIVFKICPRSSRAPLPPSWPTVSIVLARAVDVFLVLPIILYSRLVIDRLRVVLAVRRPRAALDLRLCAYARAYRG